MTERQLKAIPHIVTASTYTEGIKNAKVSRKAFYAWMKDPEFKAELVRQRHQIADEAFGILEQSMTQAVESLTGLLKTDDDRLKRQVCNDILEHVLKYKEIRQLEERLAVLEEAFSSDIRCFR